MKRKDTRRLLDHTILDRPRRMTFSAWDEDGMALTLDCIVTEIVFYDTKGDGEVMMDVLSDESRARILPLNIDPSGLSYVEGIWEQSQLTQSLNLGGGKVMIAIIPVEEETE